VLGFGVALLCGDGCMWHLNSEDFVSWPERITITGIHSNLVQTTSLPMLFEGGRHWGFTCGALRREAMFAANGTNGAPLAQPPVITKGFLGSLVRYSHKPEFINRSYVGAQLVAGGEGFAVSLGGGRHTQFVASHDVCYLLSFESHRPDKANLVLNPSIQSMAEMTNQ
jgi:hypothetical protein